MAKRFDLFHLSLIERRQPELTVFVGNREAWIRHALGQAFTFKHRTQDFHWVPGGDLGSTIFGHINREVQHVHHAPPNQGGHEVEDKEWQGSILLIDPTHHDDGQKVAFESDLRVGKTKTILTSLLQHLNELGDRPYQIEQKEIFDETNFWAFAEKHGNVLGMIHFEFIVPNMFKSVQGMAMDLKATGEETGAEKVGWTLKAKDGVLAISDLVKTAVEYAKKGGGDFKANALDGDSYRSTTQAKSSTVDVPDVDNIENALKGLLARIFDRD